MKILAPQMAFKKKIGKPAMMKTTNMAFANDNYGKPKVS